MKDQFLDLFAYDHWADTQWLDRLRTLDEVSPRTRAIMAHLPATKRVWIARLRGDDTAALPIWPSLDWDACARQLDATHADFRLFVETCTVDNLKASATYQNSKGTTFHTPVHEVLMHVITHGHYHRGQIAQAVRQQGEDPINTDYITYVRQRSHEDA